MSKHPGRFWIVVLALGWVSDFLFWGQSAGVNIAIFASLSLLGGFGLLITEGHRPAARSLWLLVPFVFFAIMSFARQEILTASLAYTFTLVSLGILAVTYASGRWIQYGLPDYFAKSVLLVGNMAAAPILFFTQVRREQLERGKSRRRLPIWPILRGVLIALPIVAFFAALLASADPIFSQRITDFFGLFDGGKIGEYIWRLFFILLCAYLLAGVFLHTESQSADEKLLGENNPIVKPFIGFSETGIVLGSVIALFFLFVIIQFQYFFGGNANIGIQGYTFSQYARSGFNELVIVAFFSLLMILGLSTITKRESNLQRQIYSGLSVVLVALVLVILASAYQRLALAIDWHGFSRLRIYPRVFLIWVGILFVAVVLLELFHRERYFAFAALIASLGFAASLSLINVDDSIVRQNVLRASQGIHFNPSYLGTLSVDAIPALADEFQDPSLSPAVHEGIGAALLCQIDSGAMSAPASGQDWRSFNLSRWNADQAVTNVRDKLIGYSVNKKTSPIRVRTPGNLLYECIDSEQ